MKKLHSYLALLGLASLVLTGCGVNNNNTSNDNGGGTDEKPSGVVPVYQGMSISSSFNKRNTNDTSSSQEQNEEDPEVELGDDEIEQDIDDLIDIEVKTDEEIKYYVQPGETFLIEVHLHNPSEYEIQSFTLNGKKYANYMFEDGSTLEKLILESTAPMESGYMEYTIDAIKYIDDEDIKNVKMSGDQTIKSGVAYTTRPTAVISNLDINTTFASMDINVSDPQGIIKDNQINAYLSDGKTHLATKALKLGDNHIEFNNLIMGNAYQVGVGTAYDFVDGKDLHEEWLLIENFNSKKAFEIVNTTATKNSIKFEVEQYGEIGEITKINLLDSTSKEVVATSDGTTKEFNNLLSNHKYDIELIYSYTINEKVHEEKAYSKDIKTDAYLIPTIDIQTITSDKVSISYDISFDDTDDVASIEKIELIKDGTIIKTNDNKLTNTFTDLLSNNKYSVKVSYSYDLHDGNGLISKEVIKDITTEALVTPSITIAKADVTENTITADLTSTDPDNILSINKVTLYKGETKVKEANAINFTNLEPYTDYVIKIDYLYDLNDGEGIKNNVLTYNFKTSPSIIFKTCEVINTSGVSEGEVIYLEVTLDNPNGAMPSSVTVNGKDYKCSKGTNKNMMFVNITNDGSFEGGDTVITVEKVTMELEGKTYAIKPTSNNVSNVFINGKLNVTSLTVVDENYNEVEYCDYSKSNKYYYALHLENKTGYDVKVDGYEKYVKVSDELYVCEINQRNDPVQKIATSVTGLSYSNKYISKTLKCDLDVEATLLKRVNVVHIKTIEDLKTNITSNSFGKYFLLDNDLDARGFEWKDLKLCGNSVFDGNGHTISNLRNISTYKNVNPNSGLFDTVEKSAVINLTISSARFIITADSGVPSIGCLAGNSYEALFADITVDDTCYVKGDRIGDANLDDNDAGIAGVVGSGSMSTFINITNNATVNGLNKTGGICCSHSYPNTFINCVNNGEITGRYCYGIAHNAKLFKGCINNGLLNSTYQSCGICDGGNEIINCINNADITGQKNVSITGICCWSTHIKDCVNNGNLFANNSYSTTGITIEAETIINCINNGNINLDNATDWNSGAAGIIFRGDVVINCINKGKVECNNNAAGIACELHNKYIPCKLEGCINYGDVIGNNKTAGILNKVNDYVDSYEFNNCINYGTIITSKGEAHQICNLSTVEYTNCKEEGKIERNPN